MTPEQIALELEFSGRYAHETEDAAKVRRLERNRLAAATLRDLSAAISQAEAYRVDAERYRAIRNPLMWTQSFLVKDDDGLFVDGDRLDAAVDASISARKPA